MAAMKNITNMENAGTAKVAKLAESAEIMAEAGATSTLEALLLSLSASSPFSNLLLSIRRTVGVRLPNTALLELPTVIEKDTQKRLVEIGNKDGFMVAGELILKSIDEINKGSLETVDRVIRKKLMAMGTTVAH